MMTWKRCLLSGFLLSLCPLSMLLADLSNPGPTLLGAPGLVRGRAITGVGCEPQCASGPNNTNGQCAAAVCANGGGSIVVCGVGTIGNVCGEIRSNYTERQKCRQDPFGQVVNCQNENASVPCVKYLACTCQRVGTTNFYNCNGGAGVAQDCNNKTRSLQCP